MNKLSDIGMALLAVIECIVTVAASLLIWLVVPLAIIGALVGVNLL